MRSLKCLAIAVASVILICVAVIGWYFVQARAGQQKLTKDAAAGRLRTEQGDPSAQYELAYMYYQGKAVPQNYTEAFAWYLKAADQGNAKAQYDLAFMYEEGKGVRQDYTAALDWGRKAADAGYARAQYALGYSYYEGKEGGARFIGFNIYATMHYDLRHLPSCPRPLYSINSMLIGMAIASALLVWLDREVTRIQNGSDSITPEPLQQAQ